MKTIYMSELAQQYFPTSTSRSAVTQLHRWIALNPPLQRRLAELFYHRYQRALTPKQHEAIVDALGKP